MPVVTTGYNKGVYVASCDVAYVNSYYGHCYRPYGYYYPYGYYGSYGYYGYYAPGFSFSVGLGCWPYWTSYYSPYPYYWYRPYYPYRYGVYVGYDSYDYPYYSAPYTVEKHYYHDTPAQAPAVESESTTVAEAPSAGTALPPVARAEPAPAPGEDPDITPLPKAEVVERSPEGWDAAPGGDAAALALEGLSAFRSGFYEEASDGLFAATQARPESQVLKVYLAQSLFAIGEYDFAAEYLRQALEARPELAASRFPLERLYARTPEGERDLAAHHAALAEWSSLDPSQPDRLLLLGFLQLNGSRPDEASRTFLALRDSSQRPLDLALSERFLAEAQSRTEAAPADPAPAEEPAGAIEEEELAAILASALE